MKQIKLTKGKVVLVDDEDFEWLNQSKWFAGTLHYKVKVYRAARWKDGKYTLMHREIMKTPPGMVVDHINHNQLDNRKINLRNVTHSQNMMNRQTQKNNTSGTPGVNWNAKNKNFNASIRVNSKTIYLGSFKILEDAIVCRKKAEDKYFGEFANK